MCTYLRFACFFHSFFFLPYFRGNCLSEIKQKREFCFAFAIASNDIHRSTALLLLLFMLSAIFATNNCLPSSLESFCSRHNITYNRVQNCKFKVTRSCTKHVPTLIISNEIFWLQLHVKENHNRCDWEHTCHHDIFFVLPFDCTWYSLKPTHFSRSK